MADSQGYDNLSVPYAYSREVVAAGAVLPALGTIIVGLRFYARRNQKCTIGADDWLMLPALLAVIAMGITLIAGSARGAIGYPTPGYTGDDPLQAYTITDPVVAITQEIDFANTLAMIAAYGFIKLSILYYYRRLFVTRKNSIVDIVTKISIGTVIAWALVFFFRFVFYCGTHFAANWYGIYNSEAYCPTGDASNEALIISEMIANIFVICLPLPIVWNLNMPTPRKIGILSLLFLAAISIVASILRLVVAFDLINATNSHANIDPDLSITTIIYWSTIEAGIALISANLPSIWCILARMARGTQNSIRSLSGASYGPSTPVQGSWLRLGNTSDSSPGLHKGERNVGGEAYATRGHGGDPETMLPKRIYLRREVSIRHSMV